MKEKQKNVLGEDLEECSNDPLTGWLRDGCCNTDENDHGVHTVCAKVTTECLEWLKEAGNDLITPHPEFGFPGLKDGDGWCLCASWYAKAVEAEKACPIGQAFSASTAFAYQLAHKHHPSPSFNPGNPNSGCGVIKSLPASFNHSKHSVVTLAQTVCTP